MRKLATISCYCMQKGGRDFCATELISQMDWHDFFFGMAKYVSQKSKDPSSQVGAVIVDGKRIVSLGFNGFPAGVRDDAEIYTDRARKLKRTQHAEANAMTFAKRDLSGCTLYVTHFPCSQCAGRAIQEGIAKVVCPAPDAAFAERWAEDISEAMAMFSEAGVEIVYHCQAA